MQLANSSASTLFFLLPLFNTVFMLSSGISLTLSEIFDVFIRMGRLLLDVYSFRYRLSSNCKSVPEYELLVLFSPVLDYQMRHTRTAKKTL